MQNYASQHVLKSKHLQHQLAVTTIYVTHDQIEAMTLADRVVVMNKGVIQQVGTPKEVYNNPINTFVASFVGTPAMNLIEGVLDAQTFKNKDCQINDLKSISKGKVILGFRAEDATIVDKSGDIKAEIYSVEILGECLMLNFMVNSSLISVKTDKDYEAKIGDKIEIKIPRNCCHLFDKKTGSKITK